MKKKLIAWMMSATMALGSMTLPVYAENEEVAVEFSDETDEETEFRKNCRQIRDRISQMPDRKIFQIIWLKNCFLPEMKW